MALVRGTINPLNVLGARRLTFIPKHFASMTIKNNWDKIDSWIYKNLDSRYAIIQDLEVDQNNKIVEIHKLGVEDPKELTILSLSCPYLDKN